MSNITNPPSSESIEKVLMLGDLSKLTTEQRLSYYKQVCESVGLNPLTQPFSYLNLGGKTVLYALKSCTEQLRKIHKVSIKISAREKFDDVYVVTAQATDSTGRCDESTGAVNVTNLKGESLANAFLKAETKAKRRVTLSICGLAFLDETEAEDIPGAKTIQLDMPQEQDIDLSQEETFETALEGWEQETLSAKKPIPNRAEEILNNRSSQAIITYGKEYAGKKFSEVPLSTLKAMYEYAKKHPKGLMAQGFIRDYEAFIKTVNNMGNQEF